MSSIQFSTENIYVINTYSPCEGNEKIHFLNYLTDVVYDYIDSSEHVICLGDFNIVMNNALDIVSGLPHSQNIVNHFNQCVSAMGLTDVWRLKHPTARNHTWRRYTPSAARRLDYILVGDGLLPLVTSSNIQSIGFSDHRAVTCSFAFATFKRGQSRYKINTSLLTDNDYLTLINKTINDSIEKHNSLDPHLKWEMIKADIREVIRQFSKHKESLKRKDITNLISELNDLEETLNSNPLNSDIKREIQNIKSKLEIFQSHKAKGAQIRSRIKWIEEGEKNTKYFLGLEKLHAKNNTLTSITDSDGNKIRDEIEILQGIKSYYANLYSETKSSEETVKSFNDFCQNLKVPQVSEEDKHICDENITESEVLNAINKMRCGSSPGVDSIPLEIYKQFWEVLKTPLIECYNHSFENGALSPSQNQGVLSLIHKGKELEREYIKNWRPIAITNVDYKIIAKLLALRLQSVVDSIVGNNQFGFIPGRNIAQLLRQVDDLFDYIKESRQEGIMLSIDFEKSL